MRCIDDSCALLLAVIYVSYTPGGCLIVGWSVHDVFRSKLLVCAQSSVKTPLQLDGSAVIWAL